VTATKHWELGKRIYLGRFQRYGFVEFSPWLNSKRIVSQAFFGD
jgi:hypothetical protein